MAVVRLLGSMNIGLVISRSSGWYERRSPNYREASVGPNNFPRITEIGYIHLTDEVLGHMPMLTKMGAPMSATGYGFRILIRAGFALCKGGPKSSTKGIRRITIARRVN